MKNYYIYYVKYFDEERIIVSLNNPKWFKMFSNHINSNYEFELIEETSDLSFAINKYQAESFNPIFKKEVV